MKNFYILLSSLFLISTTIHADEQKNEVKIEKIAIKKDFKKPQL